MTTPRDPWSDERLEAAFAARARQHGAPPQLSDAVVEAVRHAGAPAAQGRPWATLVPLAAAVALVAVVLGGPLLAGRLGDGPTPPPSTAPSTSGVDERAFGLPVIDVRAAAAVRDAGVDDRAIAVRGWLAFDGIECPAIDEALVSPLQLGCEGQRRALLADPDPALVGPGADPDPSVLLRPLFDWTPDVPSGEVAEIVVVGHFDDRRAAVCPPEELQACRDRFVVDRLVSVDGREVGDLPVEGIDRLESSREIVEALVAQVVPEAQALSTIVTSGTDLHRVEPALGTGVGGFIDDAAIWLVRVLEGHSVDTFLIVDGETGVWRLEEDGPAVEVPLPSPAITDPSGLVWTEHAFDLPAGVAVCDVARLGERFYAVALAGDEPPCARILESTDGYIWREVARDRFDGFSVQLHSLEDRLVAVGTRSDEAGDRFEHRAWWSADGTSWTELGIPSGEVRFPAAITALDGVLFAAGERRIFRWDGLQWTRVGDLVGYGGQLARSGPGGMLFLDVDEDDVPDARLWHSQDGAIWSKVELPSGGAPVTVQDMEMLPIGSTAIGGIGAFAQERPAAWWSPDGVSWEEVPLPVLREHERSIGIDIVPVQGGAVAVGLADSGAFARSIVWWTADGREWVETGRVFEAKDPPLASGSHDGAAYLFWRDRIWIGSPSTTAQSAPAKELLWESGAYQTPIALGPDADPSLRDMRFPTDDDPEVQPASDQGLTVLAEPGDPDSVRVIWTGLLCDERAVISVPRPDEISVQTDPTDGPCRLKLVYRSVILTFDGPVDLTSDGG